MRKLFAIGMVLMIAFAVCGVCETEAPDETIQLYAEEYPEVLRYDGIWFADGDTMRIEIDSRMDGVEIIVFQMLGDLEWTSWEYLAEFDAAAGTLVSVPGTGMKSWNKGDADGNITESTYEYEDGTAVFSLNEDGELLWKDGKEDAGAGLAFIGIGAFAGEYISDEAAKIEMVWNPHELDYDVDVSIREAEGVSREWVMKGIYDPLTRSISATGISERVTVKEDGTVDLDADPEPAEVAAEFSFDNRFNLVIRTDDAVLAGLNFEHLFTPLWMWDL